MKATLKMALLPTLILLLTAVFAYAQEANQPEPPAAPPPEPQVTPPPELQNRPRFMLDEAYIAELLEKVKQNDPNEAQRLENLRKENPGLFQVEIRKLAFQQHRASQEEGPGPDRFSRREAMQGPPTDESTALRGKEWGRERLHEKETELISWLEKNEPSDANQLAALKEKDPRAYMRRLAVEMKKYREIIEAEKTNPAMAEVLKKDLGLKQERNELLEKYKSATDEKQKKELTAQLKEVLGERFEVFLQKKQLKYEELKKKLEELQKDVKKSQADFESIKSKKTEQVEQKLKDLLSQSEKIEWD